MSPQRQITFVQLAKTFLRSRGGLVILAFVLPVCLRLTMDRLKLLDGLLAFAIVGGWPVLEWLFHRYLLHEWTFLDFHRTHTRHHDNPTPDNGLPDTYVIIVYFVITVTLWVFSRVFLMTVNVAVLGMLMLYEFVHFSTHANYKPMTRYGWRVRTNHLRHHNLDETRGFSMLFPLGSRHDDRG